MKKTLYRARHANGKFARACGVHIIEADSIERLADRLAYAFHRTYFKLALKKSGAKRWETANQYQNECFSQALDKAFLIDEYH